MCFARRHLFPKPRMSCLYFVATRPTGQVDTAKQTPTFCPRHAANIENTHSNASGSNSMKSALMPAENKQYTLFPCSLFNLLFRYMSQQELEENIIPVSLFSGDNRGKLQPYGGCNFAWPKRRKQIPSTVVFNPLPFSMFIYCFIHFIGAKSVKNISFVNVSKIFDEETKQVGEILFKN